MDEAREVFTSPARREHLDTLREIARWEGRPFYVVLEEAMREYIDRKTTDRPGREILEAIEASLEDFDHLYGWLAE